MLLCFPPQTFARSLKSCWGIGVAEFLIPGLGYSILNDWEKAALLGGSRWIALFSAAAYTNDKEFQGDPEKVYVKTEKEGEFHEDVYLTRETFFGNLSLSVYSNLTAVAVHDLYEESCQKNSKTYSYMLSPFQWREYGAQSTFLLPMSALLGALAVSPGTGFTYHVESGLHRNELLLGTFLGNQLVGIGEEMLFRGLIQRSLFGWFSKYYSKPVARWSSIVSASAIFGAAHSGVGGTAGPGLAFLSGLYLGWVYHPAEGEFDLQQAIALHAWWDTLIDFHRISHSEVRQLKQEGTEAMRQAQPLPLLNIVYRF